MELQLYFTVCYGICLSEFSALATTLSVLHLHCNSDLGLHLSFLSREYSTKMKFSCAVTLKGNIKFRK